MNWFRGISLILVGTLLGLLCSLTPVDARPEDTEEARAYREAVQRTAAMVQNREAVTLAAAHQLQVLNITWEDTGRFKNSAVGPNISDMTIQVQTKDPKTGEYHLNCMPVIRGDNFNDKTGDIKPEKFSLLVGNEKGQGLMRVSLLEYLGNFRKYLNKPRSWKGDHTYLHADRDTHVLVSAQACFLPVPKKDTAEFNPVLFNYQSRKGEPAVLAILATREGTSATIIDNQRDGFVSRGVWGQRLFFNHNGERASFTGQRLSDFKASGTGDKTNTDPSKTPDAADQGGLNMVLLIQVPLKQRELEKKPLADNFKDKDKDGGKDKDKDKDKGGGRSDVEEAVIGHGKVEGPFTEIDDLAIERDTRFPIRVTVQFYKATSNGVVSKEDIDDIAKQIKKVYDQADYVGSLVTEGHTQRPTEYDGPKVESPEWWSDFWRRHHENTGRTQDDVVREVRRVKGDDDWVPLTEQELAKEAELLTAGVSPGKWSLFGWIAVGVLVVAAIGIGAVYSGRKPRET